MNKPIFKLEIGTLVNSDGFKVLFHQKYTENTHKTIQRNNFCEAGEDKCQAEKMNSKGKPLLA